MISQIPVHAEIRRKATMIFWCFRVLSWLVLIQTGGLMLAIGFLENVGTWILRLAAILWLLTAGAYVMILASINDTLGGMVVKMWKAVGPALNLEEHQREVVEAARQELANEESRLP